MSLGGFRKLGGTILTLIVGLLWLIDSTAWADADTDRLQHGSREILEQPYYKAPFPCSLVGSSKDHYIVDMPSWAAAAGLRRGDRIVAYGGTRLTGVDDPNAWAQLPRGEYVEIRVQRAGNEMSLRLPCRDDRDDLSCPEIGTARATIESFSEANDLAVLRISQGRTPNCLSIANQKSVTLGQQVFTIGYPAPDILGSEAKFTEGVVSSLSVGGDAGYMQISVPVQPGNSGGPLLNGSGEVVGIVVATASALSFLKGTGALPQNVSWAVKSAFAAPQFDAPPPSLRVADRDAAIRRALKSICAVTASAEAQPDSPMTVEPANSSVIIEPVNCPGTSSWNGVGCVSPVR
jgi:S1-C subfamily serine protease